MEWLGHTAASRASSRAPAVLPAQGLTISVSPNSSGGLPFLLLEGQYSISCGRSPARRADPQGPDWTGRWWSLWGASDLVPMGDKVLVAAPRCGTRSGRDRFPSPARTAGASVSRSAAAAMASGTPRAQRPWQGRGSMAGRRQGPCPRRRCRGNGKALRPWSDVRFVDGSLHLPNHAPLAATDGSPARGYPKEADAVRALRILRRTAVHRGRHRRAVARRRLSDGNDAAARNRRAAGILAWCPDPTGGLIGLKAFW